MAVYQQQWRIASGVTDTAVCLTSACSQGPAVEKLMVPGGTGCIMRMQSTSNLLLIADSVPDSGPGTFSWAAMLPMGLTAV